MTIGDDPNIGILAVQQIGTLRFTYIEHTNTYTNKNVYKQVVTMDVIQHMKTIYNEGTLARVIRRATRWNSHDKASWHFDTKDFHTFTYQRSSETPQNMNNKRKHETRHANDV